MSPAVLDRIVGYEWLYPLGFFPPKNFHSEHDYSYNLLKMSS